MEAAILDVEAGILDVEAEILVLTKVDREEKDLFCEEEVPLRCEATPEMFRSLNSLNSLSSCIDCCCTEDCFVDDCFCTGVEAAEATAGRSSQASAGVIGWSFAILVGNLIGNGGGARASDACVDVLVWNLEGLNENAFCAGVVAAASSGASVGALDGILERLRA